MGSYAEDGLCHNAEPGTYGHECGKPAVWIGTAANGFESGFCDDCRRNGYEARNKKSWRPLERHLYRPQLRPVGRDTLPAGVTWDYVAKPASFVIRRPDLPQSRHPYGEIVLSRRLTLDECDRFGLVWFDSIKGGERFSDSFRDSVHGDAN